MFSFSCCCRTNLIKCVVCWRELFILLFFIVTCVFHHDILMTLVREENLVQHFVCEANQREVLVEEELSSHPSSARFPESFLHHSMADSPTFCTTAANRFFYLYIYIFACIRSHTLLCVERVTETWLPWLINAIYIFRVVFYSSFGVMVSSWCLNDESNSINAAPRPPRPPRPPSADVACWSLLKSSKKPFLLFLCRIENENGLVTGLM